MSPSFGMAARRRLLLLAPMVLGLSIVYMMTSRAESGPAPPLLPGRNNTVLFVTTEASGISNVHVAASLALLEEHPLVEVHYAFFPKLRDKLSRMSTVAAAKRPGTRPIQFHELPGRDGETAALQSWGSYDHLITAPGFRGVKKTMQLYGNIAAGLSHEEHLAIYRRLVEITEAVDPSLIVLDTVLKPGGDLITTLNRRFAFLSPNIISEYFAAFQPWGAGFWKYPAITSGHPYPLPWKLIPANIFLQMRIVFGLVTNPQIAAMQRFLKAHGVKNPVQPGFVANGVPVVMATFPEANLPLSFIPDTVKFSGPAVLNTAPVEEQDPELASWLRQRPTIMVNLGSLVQFSRHRAQVMVEAIRIVLATANCQVLWKFRKAGAYDDDIFDPVKGHIDSQRLRIKTWLQADPVSLLQSGDIAVSVHHGGAGCFHEAVLAGIPQVILPLWFDLYSIAQTAEFLGIGIWPGQDTAPDWEPGVLARGFLDALDGERSVSMRAKAQSLAVKAHSYGGRRTAAGLIAQMAAEGTALSRG